MIKIIIFLAHPGHDRFEEGAGESFLGAIPNRRI
jgi:hypothetical protein